MDGLRAGQSNSRGGPTTPWARVMIPIIEDVIASAPGPLQQLPGQGDAGIDGEEAKSGRWEGGTQLVPVCCRSAPRPQERDTQPETPGGAG